MKGSASQGRAAQVAAPLRSCGLEMALHEAALGSDAVDESRQDRARHALLGDLAQGRRGFIGEPARVAAEHGKQRICRVAAREGELAKVARENLAEPVVPPD